MSHQIEWRQAATLQWCVIDIDLELDRLWHMPRRLVIAERHVKVFKNGRNRAVRIPREFEFPGEDAVMRKEGDRLIIEPAPPKSLLSVLATLSRLDENFAPILDESPDQVDR
jgi:antitoxin VapB